MGRQFEQHDSLSGIYVKMQNLKSKFSDSTSAESFFSEWNLQYKATAVVCASWEIRFFFFYHIKVFNVLAH